MSRIIKIGNKKKGNNNPFFIIAELSANIFQNFDLAIEQSMGLDGGEELSHLRRLPCMNSIRSESNSLYIGVFMKAINKHKR
jgi:hypothetical protein